jgi:integrase
MTKKPKTLTARRMAKLPPGRYRDPEAPGLGLYLQVGPTRTRSWLLRYQVGELERFMGLGSAALFSLKQARQRAIEARRLLADNIDPIEHRRAAKDAKRAEAINNVTFKRAAEEYIALHADGWKNAKHRQQWRNTMRDYAYPALGERLVSGIDAAAINDAIAPIWQRIPDSAKRTKNRIERVIEWVKEGKPLPKPAAAKRVRHHPAMPYAEVPGYMAELRGREGVAPLALQFLILTAARTGEVVGSTWDEVDFDHAVWRIPAQRMKSGKPHAVPLSRAASELLRVLPRERGNEHLFIGGRRSKPLSDMAMLALMRRTHPDFVPHGFRSSFRDWCGDCTNFPREVAEAALAHTLRDKTEAAYRRATALEKRRKLMDAWARYCTRPAPAGNVVPLRRTKG